MSISISAGYLSVMFSLTVWHMGEVCVALALFSLNLKLWNAFHLVKFSSYSFVRKWLLLEF
jgi:hypothetical protein